MEATQEITTEANQPISIEGQEVVDTSGIQPNIFAPKNIPIESLIEYRSRGLSYNDIAKLVGCSRPNVVNRLKAVSQEIDSLPDYKKHRADVIALTGKRILSSITPDKLKDASAYQLTGMYGVLYDKERLERDLSTANVNTVIGDIEALRKDRAKVVNKDTQDAVIVNDNNQ